MFAEDVEPVRPQRLRLVSNVSHSSVTPAPEIPKQAVPGSPTESLLNGLEEDLQRPAVGVHGGHIAWQTQIQATMSIVNLMSQILGIWMQTTTKMPRSFQAAFASLDAVDLQAEFCCRPCLMRSLPGFL